MNCRSVEERLSDYLEGLLPDAQAERVAAHLRDCGACRRLREALTAFEGEVRVWSDAPPAPGRGPWRRALDRWSTERETIAPAVQGRVVRPACLTLPGWMNGRRRLPALVLSPASTRALVAGVALAAVLAVLGLVRWDHSRPHGAPGPVLAHQPPRAPLMGLAPSSPPRPHEVRAFQADPSPETPPTAPAAAGSRSRDSRSGTTAMPPSGNQASISRPGRSTEAAGDLGYMNGDPTRAARQLAALPGDEWDEIAARVLRTTQVRDDFVTIPFPRLASRSPSNQQVAAAVESYKAEAAIVDARLSREATLAVKGIALSDLCDQLRKDTGIQLEAGRSVADEKVTVFCEKMPLREVMRQLARPFGYTWLRSGKEGEYRYELVQDLRSQLLEEELRNRDRNAALLALAQNIERCRPLLNLSPEEALARARTAAPADKEMLEMLAGPGWGPLQMYFRLSPQELAALRAGQTLKFNQEPREGELPLPAEVARGVIERLPEERFLPRGDRFVRTRADDPSGVPLTALPDIRARVSLTLNQSELGRFTLSGGPGFSSRAAGTVHLLRGANVVGQSPRVLQPNNRLANAALARDPALRKVVTVSGVRRQASGVSPTSTSTQRPSTDASRLTPDALPRVTSADVLEALHRASGMPIVSDYYTHLYAPQDVTVQDRPLFEVLNQLADTMRMRWTKDGEWLQFRTTSYYDDRLKEVPNRLLARWARSRKEQGFLSLEALTEIAQLTDAQLQAEDMAAGARELFGLEEWNFVRKSLQLAHLRFLAGFTPAQREATLSPAGLPFAQMTLAQQQEFINFVFVRYYGGPTPQANVDLQELAGALLRVAYTPPVGFEWRRPSRPGEELDTLFRMRGQTREAVLATARQIDPQASPDQIVPTERSLALAYIAGRREDGLRGLAIRATDNGASIGGKHPSAPVASPAAGK